MDSLIRKHNVTALRTALVNLPKEVNDIYDKTMERIEQQNEEDRDLAIQILSWIIFACRPLRVTELQHALAIVQEMTQLDPDSMIDEELLTSVCAGLIMVDKERIVRLVRKLLG
jgi:hypothetical protein